ncbi:hypothetical protein SCLCIDRAFT_33857 [Scleroderma citrinum Foug A]|uniref:RRM domain-containing protein n=1 Tax=Scleroderma citrinum Foug A TaxID=1036808 RepID=A0A0C2YMG9_9AGAM|nr:hypothetical protein SCLCIDRAFT_33857 [Scleroderma citrinum Foug A]
MSHLDDAHLTKLNFLIKAAEESSTIENSVRVPPETGVLTHAQGLDTDDPSDALIDPALLAISQVLSRTTPIPTATISDPPAGTSTNNAHFSYSGPSVPNEDPPGLNPDLLSPRLYNTLEWGPSPNEGDTGPYGVDATLVRQLQAAVVLNRRLGEQITTNTVEHALEMLGMRHRSHKDYFSALLSSSTALLSDAESDDTNKSSKPTEGSTREQEDPTTPALPAHRNIYTPLICPPSTLGVHSLNCFAQMYMREALRRTKKRPMEVELQEDEALNKEDAEAEALEAIANSLSFLPTTYSLQSLVFIDMDDMQTAFVTHYPSYGFDLDMMKRSMESVGGPDAKQARWLPTSLNGTTSALSTNSSANTSDHDAFTNYGYGPQASINQPVFQPSSSPAFTPTQLYLTPSLSINTGVGMNGQVQMSPHPMMSAGFMQKQQHQQHQQQQGMQGQMGQFRYGMLGMGLPSGMLGGFGYMSLSGTFSQGFAQQTRLPSLNVNIPPTPGAYLPAAQCPNQTHRYVGNLPATASVDELLNLVHFGPLESIRVLPEKLCIFKLSLHGQELKIGWGKPSPVSTQVQLAIQQSNTSRNVYLGGLDECTTEEQLRDDLSWFGLIDQVKIMRDKNIGFVHFLSIAVATKVVNTLPTEPAWAGKRINYGKDRCVL